MGFDQLNYNAQRNCYAPVPGVTFKRAWRLPIDRIIPSAASIRNSFVPAAPSRVDLVHTWNRVSWGRCPWGVSFEEDLPRDMDASGKFGAVVRRRLEDAGCRFLIAISEFARRVLIRDTDGSEAIIRKLQQVYPYQPPIQRQKAYVPPDGNEPLRLLFVGGDFFRKGGEGLLRAIEDEGDELDLSCTIISRVTGEDLEFVQGSSEGSIRDDKIAAVRRRLTNSPRIRWVPSMNNSEVLREMSDSHLGLLPTLADTFGYSALECLALGVPVIGSNVQALPEFVDESVGWVVELPVDRWGFWRGTAVGSTPSHYESAVVSIATQLSRFLNEARRTPSLLLQHSERATKRIETHFDPVSRGKAIRGIYERSLGRRDAVGEVDR